MSKNLIPLVIIVAGIIVVGIIVGLTNPNLLNRGKEAKIETLSVEEVSEKVIGFINTNLLTGANKASLVNALEENGLYKIKFKIEGQDREIDVYASKDGKLFFPDVIDLTSAGAEAEVVEKETTLGGFSLSAEEVCQENGKPIIYFFGSQQCGFCQWEHPIMEKVANKFGQEISFHNNMDSTNDQDIFSKYSSGGIPTMVFGCRYYKTGAGQSNGEEGEAKILTALICKLTGNKPENVCSEVKDLIEQIKN